MEFSEDWKSLFPIYSSIASPLLLFGPEAEKALGPLFFNPDLGSRTVLCSTPPPSLIEPPPQLDLPQFLSSSAYVPLSSASAIAPDFGPVPINEADPIPRNHLCLLHFQDYVFVFFPTGDNFNHVGFSVLGINNGSLEVLFDKDGGFRTASTGSSHRIQKIVVNPVADMDFEDSGSARNGYVAVGYLLVYTMHSVHWFEVQMHALGSEYEKPVVALLGSKVFKSCSVVDACWSPHLEEQSVVLLDSGELFLFDLERCLKNKCFRGTNLRVKWGDDDRDSSTKCKWLAVEFSWHPRILIVARSDAVFIIDLRDDEHKVSPLLKIDTLRRHSLVKIDVRDDEHKVSPLLKIDTLRRQSLVQSDSFFAFCKAGSDGFHYVLASSNMLILCDVRKPLMPVLLWDHGLKEPSYVNVFRLSELRSHSQDQTFKWASESGFGIIIGSFWSGEFSLFCYGPPLVSKKPKFCESLYAWGLPSGIKLLGCDCWCGTCLLKEEFMKNTIPEWIQWQRKKEIVLGFGIVSKTSSNSHKFGGFTMVRLMSSGKLESQRYYASSELVKKSEEAHQRSSFCFEDDFLCSLPDEEYKFDLKFKYLELDYLYGYLNGNLGEVLHSNFNNPAKGTQKTKPFNSGSHEILCKKLKACGSNPSVIYNDVSMPTSVREVGLRRMWASLPVGLLQLAFSSYSEFMEVLIDNRKGSLEFLLVPDLPQLPPFFLRKFPSLARSNRWSTRVKQPEDEDGLAGPVVPLPILLHLRELHIGGPDSEEIRSPEMELELRCEEVMEEAKKMGILGDEVHAVDLGDDGPETATQSLEPKPFVLYRPATIDCASVDQSFGTVICRAVEKEVCDRPDKEAGLGMFDSLSPMVLKFSDDDDNGEGFGVEELKAYKQLKKQYSKWAMSFD